MNLYGPRLFDLFAEEGKVLVVRTKRERLKDLQDPTIPFDHASKRGAHESRVSKVDNECNELRL